MTVELHHTPAHHAAIRQDGNGRLQLDYNAKVPRLRPHTVLVKVAAVALNPYDYKLPLHFPSPGTTGGSDFAGTVVKLCPQAAVERPNLAVGDLVSGCVYGWNPDTPENGAFAQYVLADVRLVFRIGAYSLEEAATFNAGFATLCLALWHPDALGLLHTPTDPFRASSSASEYVLIYGGSTATGTLALQLLKMSGFSIIATCSPRNFSLVKAYGADHVLDYSHPDTPSEIRKLTGGKLSRVLDCISDHHSIGVSQEAIGRLGGRLVTLELAPDPRPGAKRRRVVKQYFVDGHEIFGVGVLIDSPGYRRDPSPEKHSFAVQKALEFQKLIDKGKLRAHPVEIIEGGLEGIVHGLAMLKAGVSGKKLVLRLR